MLSTGRLLALLRERQGRYLSGEELSQRLHVSRTAVWKHVHHLTQAGYRITAVPHLGYRLLEAPDLLLPDEIQAGLRTRWLGRTCLCFRELPSTNDRALQAAAAGAVEGTLVAAEHQTRGRGRSGRTWLSRPRANLLFSLILRPDWPVEHAPLLTLLAATAVARAIRRHTGLPAEIKWPNDVLLAGTKLAGILTEMQARGDWIQYLVCGIGLNVNAAPSGPLPMRAGSLAGHLGRPLERLPVLRAVLEELENLYHEARDRGRGVVVERWRPLAAYQGVPVQVTAGGEAFEGTTMGVDDTGALLLRLDGGAVRRVASGEVTLLVPRARTAPAAGVNP